MQPVLGDNRLLGEVSFGSPHVVAALVKLYNHRGFFEVPEFAVRLCGAVTAFPIWRDVFDALGEPFVFVDEVIRSFSEIVAGFREAHLGAGERGKAVDRPMLAGFDFEHRGEGVGQRVQDGIRPLSGVAPVNAGLQHDPERVEAIPNARKVNLIGFRSSLLQVDTPRPTDVGNEFAFIEFLDVALG